MTRSDPKPPILIVQPPMVSPAQDLSPLRRWAESLDPDRRRVDLCDANRAFYERFLFPAGRPAAAGAAGAFKTLLAAGDSPVEESARAMFRVQAHLSELSAGIFPTRMGWGWVWCPGLRGPGDVDAFLRDRSVNPFCEMAEGFAAAVLAGGYGAVGFWVADDVQGPAALTLADACRRIAPEIRSVMIAPARKTDGPASCFDGCADAGRPADPDDFRAPGPQGAEPGSRGDLSRKTGSDPGIWTGYTCRLRSEEGKDPDRAPPRVIRWRIDERGLSALAGELKKTARNGFWNHLDFFGDAAARDPFEAPTGLSAVHSFCRWEGGPFRWAGAHPVWPERVDGYAGVNPLPGAPFWCVLKDPSLIERRLADTSPEVLSRWRFQEETGSAFRLGAELDYRFLAPDALSPGEMDEVCAMVVAGGSVGTRWVRHNLERAFLIGVVTERGVIVANSSLKHPRREYIEAVSRAAGLDLSGFLERGYTSVRPEYRNLGIGTRLLEGLTARARGYRIFSIIGEDNVATQKIALHNRTRKVLTFFSQSLGKRVGLWMPEQTADEVLQNRKGS